MKIWLAACVAAAICVAATSVRSDDATQPAVPALPAALQDAIRISPFPEMSLLVPKGWFAFDPAQNAQLGGYKLPDQMIAGMCKPAPASAADFKVYYPNLVQLMIVMVRKLDRQGTKANMLDRMSASELKRGTEKICSMFEASGGLGAANCNLERGSVGGRNALVGTITGTRITDGMTLIMRLFAIPEDDAVLMAFFADSDTNHATTGPILDAMMNSIQMN